MSVESRGPDLQEKAAVEPAEPRLHLTAPSESVQLLDGGEATYPRMLSAIAQARRTVHLQVYTFEPTGVGARFVAALAAAAARGVAVEVVVDGWGSALGGRTVASLLRQAGCQVRIYHRLLALFLGRLGRNHRKILLVDDEVAILGGININDENLDQGGRHGWADVALEIRGPQSGHLGRRIRREPDQPEARSALRIELCGLGGGWRLRRRYLEAIAGARKRILVAHGYFLPDRGIVRALAHAARRGVEVQLLLAGRSDVPLARLATWSLYRRLLGAGVSIREWTESVLHAKVACVDGLRLLVGSFNLDPFSLANMETLVTVSERQVVGQGEAWIQDHQAHSHPVTAVEAGSRLHRWLLEPLGWLVARLVDGMSRVVASRQRRQAPALRAHQPQDRAPGSRPGLK
jgi:cardiolipin synthase